LYEYLGWDCPKFAHLPLLLKPDGNGKLSKRDGDRLGFPVFPLEWKNPESGEISSGYRERGFFAEAFTNMLAFLGWNPGTNQEIFSLEELVEAFSLQKVGKAGARFDFEKAKWFNQQYLRAYSDSELATLVTPEMEEKGWNTSSENLEKIVGMMKERATFTHDLLAEAGFFFEAPKSYDEKTTKKKWKEDSAAILGELSERFAAAEDFSSASVEGIFKAYLEEKEYGFGKVGPIFRLAITGVGMGPSMFDILEIIGKDATLSRIETACTQLG
jgi:glutamyl-tRNA synthetase